MHKVKLFAWLLSLTEIYLVHTSERFDIYGLDVFEWNRVVLLFLIILQEFIIEINLLKFGRHSH